ncbi:MAG: hypothetical protein ACPG06_11765, partial [Alphaproteobacteria bacterium]
MKPLASLILIISIAALPAFAESDPAASADTAAEVSAPLSTPPESEADRLSFEKLPGFLRWIDPRLNRARIATTLPDRDVPRGAANAIEELGRVAFRYPGLLGGWAAKARLSCDTCHTNGGANANFRIDPLSGTRGKVDMTNALFNAKANDDVFNPRSIPDLRNAKAPFGTLQPQASREAFIDYRIMTEFGGAKPAPLIAKALAAYLRALPDTRNAPPEADPLHRVLEDHKGAGKLVRVAFNDLDRTIAVLGAAIQSKRPDIITFVTRAARSEIGRLYERLDPQDPARKRLVIQGRQLAEVPNAVEGQNWREALKITNSVRRKLAAMDHAITARADLTFFNRLRIRYFLEPELMWQ